MKWLVSLHSGRSSQRTCQLHSDLDIGTRQKNISKSTTMFNLCNRFSYEIPIGNVGLVELILSMPGDGGCCKEWVSGVRGCTDAISFNNILKPDLENCKKPPKILTRSTSWKLRSFCTAVRTHVYLLFIAQCTVQTVHCTLYINCI